MNGVAIHDLNPCGYLAFDLKDIILSLGQDGLDRVWRCEDLECTGQAMQELERLESTRAWISGRELLALAERTNQVIWGDFFGRFDREDTDSLRISAIDSSYWEVFGEDAALAKVRAAFRDVRPAYQEAS